MAEYDFNTGENPSELCDRLATEFATRFKEGGNPRIELYLERVRPAEQPELLGELVREEHLLRREKGELPTLDEYKTRFPDSPEVLQNAFFTKREEGGVDYALIRDLGAGGSGTVYLARDNASAAKLRSR